MNSYHFDLAAYAASANHLSAVEDGAYRRLLDAYYRRETCLPVSIDECCRLARANSKKEFSAVRTVVLEFFRLELDGWHITRCDREIARHSARSGQSHYQRFRSLVLGRDGAWCAYCGCENEPLELDHVFPRSRGGPDHPDNLTPACKTCNASKGARTPEEWRSR